MTNVTDAPSSPNLGVSLPRWREPFLRRSSRYTLRADIRSWPIKTLSASTDTASPETLAFLIPPWQRRDRIRRLFAFPAPESSSWPKSTSSHGPRHRRAKCHGSPSVDAHHSGPGRPTIDECEPGVHSICVVPSLMKLYGQLGRVLSYPTGFTCHKCQNTGYKESDPSHPCRKVKFFTTFQYLAIEHKLTSMRTEVLAEIWQGVERRIQNRVRDLIC